MHREVAANVFGLSYCYGRPNSDPEGIFRPIAIALRRLLYLFDIDLE